MRRLIEWLVGLCIIAAMAAASFSQKQFNGSWGVEPTPEVLKVWDQYSDQIKAQYKAPLVLTIRRSSEPVRLFDENAQRNVKAVKFEYHRKFVEDLNPDGRRETVVVAYDDDGIVRSFWEGKGPKEYREAF